MAFRKTVVPYLQSQANRIDSEVEKKLRFFRNSGTTHPKTQRHIPKEFIIG